VASTRSGNEVEIVITVPEPFGARLASRFGVRTTLGVLTELLASARQHVVIAAPFMQGAEGLHAGPLGMALIAALKRGVRLDLISTGTSLAGLDLGSLRELAGTRFRTFQPRENVEDPRMLGSHAKFCLCDAEHAYIGSANITQKGISGHLELGVLLHGSRVVQLEGLVRALVDAGYFVDAHEESRRRGPARKRGGH
jgi:phosphatidylserine/phosphatidylglycerophosphate/cardiolipin synthase-like enzyme